MVYAEQSRQNRENISIITRDAPFVEGRKPARG